MKTEAWILRNLVTIVSQAAKRPHTPRSGELKEIFKAIGIVIEKASPSSGSLGILLGIKCRALHSAISFSFAF